MNLSIQNDSKYFFFSISIFFPFLYRYVKSAFNKQQKVNIQFISEKEKFQKFFQGSYEHTNKNIHNDVFDVEKYKSFIQDDNDEEKKWRSRILLHNTNKGNIIIYYNLYKFAFSYYADSQMPYSILNTAAMKYVRTFYCRDFFIDTIEFPDSIHSSLIEMKKKESENEKKKKEEKKKNLNIDFDDSVFVSKKPEKKLNKNENKTNVHRSRNTFCYMGKIRDSSIIQKPPLDHHTIIHNYDYIQYKKTRSTNNTFDLSTLLV
jgi:hypothetical protein